MTRSIVGVLDWRDRSESSRVAGALEPRASHLIDRRPLRVSFSGETALALEPLCLLDGSIDNARAIAGELGASPDLAPEELLAAGYQRWGEDLLPRLRGDFLLLLWDGQRQEGLLARDQLGVRSLYLHELDGCICFAGEICHLLALLSRRPAPDPAGVAHWVTARPRADAGTLYAGVRALAPSCLLRLRPGARMQERCYWRPTFLQPQRRSEIEDRVGLREAIDSAVARRLSPAADTGVLMSGGLDSAAVAAVAAARAPGRVRAYSGVFPQHPAVDESQLIRQLCGALALDGVTAEVRTGGLVASGLEYLRVWQLPLLSWGEFWTLPLVRAGAAAGVDVMLGGDGGDELFDTRAYLLADRLRGRDLRAVLRLARELPGAGDHPPLRGLRRAVGRFAVLGALPYGLHGASRRAFAPRALPAWLTPRAARALREGEDPQAWKRLDGPRWWARAAHDLTRAIEQTGILELHRHRGALAGVPTRHPLLDLDLVKFVLASEPVSTFDRYRNRPALRAAMAGLLPDAVRLRARKTRFDSLIVDTLTGADAAAVRSLLCDRAAELRAYVDLETVEHTLLKTAPGASLSPVEWMRDVWRLTTVECWLRAQSDPDLEKLANAVGASPARVVLFSALTGPERSLHSMQA